MSSLIKLHQSILLIEFKNLYLFFKEKSRNSTIFLFCFEITGNSKIVKIGKLSVISDKKTPDVELFNMLDQK